MYFFSKRHLRKLKFFDIIDIMKAGNPRGGLPAFYRIHFFSRRNPSLPYGCTATKRMFDDSAHFYLSPSHRDAKKVQTEKVKW